MRAVGHRNVEMGGKGVRFSGTQGQRKWRRGTVETLMSRVWTASRRLLEAWKDAEGRTEVPTNSVPTVEELWEQAAGES